MGARVREGVAYDDAVRALQTRLDGFKGAYTPLLRALAEESKAMPRAERDGLVAEVLFGAA